ncbi:hypothetical protein SV7mr_21450 [Stieleria bergensis]|uniref:Cytochrome C n=1 Tax=Stieleria bergensis TaxID=2528025 RepID=A0A517SU29_9BACT|nr:hypothetical protein SV7mr_21450 [Planctomycetes bacterium SV_7m_r]
MRAQTLSKNRVAVAACFLVATACWLVVAADEKRAAKPAFNQSTTKAIFFDSVSSAIRGQRPTIDTLRQQTAAAAAPAATGGGATGGAPKVDGTWDNMITAGSIEDEVKKRKLHYDSVVTLPGPFKSGGYQDARLDLMVMASLFAVISEYKGEVRFKKDAAAARDLLARTAFRCNSGTSQVFNEANARKEDLQSLMSGSGLGERRTEEGNDWSAILDRSPLMEYMEELKDQLKTASNSEAAVKAEPNEVRRPAELLAIIGYILHQEGMDDADDEDYKAYCVQMTNGALTVRRGLDANDYKTVGDGVGVITTSCDDCHGEYR